MKPALQVLPWSVNRCLPAALAAAVVAAGLLTACGVSEIGDKPPEEQVAEEENGGDDPRDTPPVQIFGEEIDTVVFEKYVVAIGFDVFDTRGVLGGGGRLEPGEPSQGTGQLLPPLGDGQDRPLPWSLTPTGKAVKAGGLVLPPDCAGLAAQIPQPAHRRWTNPRDIVLQVGPGSYSVFVDDLDCSTGEVEIRKQVELRVTAGGCRFAGNPPADWTQQQVIFTEPKGWSIQPSPVIFGGELMVPNPFLAPCDVAVQVIKSAKNWPDEHVQGKNYDMILVRLVP